MRRARFFVRQPIRIGQTMPLPQFAADHAIRVLRMREGDAITVFNGDGHDYAGRVAYARKGEAGVHVDAQASVDVESPLAITLVQAIVRSEKMDWILQKATELGVVGIVPIVTDRTEVKLDAERAERRVAHWEAVVASACEQSGRSRLPTIAEPVKLSDWAASLDESAGLRLALDPDGDIAPRDLPAESRATLAVGPEGGLSDHDLATLAVAGFRSLRLGPRILRTETAGLAAIAAMQALIGDI